MTRRSATLVERFAQAHTDQERTEAADALIALDDPGLAPALQATLLDRTASEPKRVAASHVLQQMSNTPHPTDTELRRWWGEDCQVLKRHALGLMRAPQRDIVEAVLDDDQHPLHLDAVSTLVFGFPSRWASQRLVRALHHPLAEVRTVAADALVWDEPEAASRPLVQAAEDPDERVAEAALSTLCYYPTLATIACAHSLLERGSDSARNCHQWVREDVLSALAIREHESWLRGWLSPVWSMLDIEPSTIEDARQQPHAASVSRAAGEDPAWLCSLGRQLWECEDDAEERARQLLAADWSRVPADMRHDVSELLVTAADVHARECAARVFGAWRHRDGLIALFHDRAFTVRKSAMYYLRELEPDPELAQLAWEHLPNATGVDASQTLETAIALSEQQVWVPRAHELVMAYDVEESVRCCAVWALDRAKAASALASCVEVLSSPPAVTWGLHVALIDAALALDLPLPNLATLRDVDHLAVQSALAAVEAKRGK